MAETTEPRDDPLMLRIEHGAAVREYQQAIGTDREATLRDRVVAIEDRLASLRSTSRDSEVREAAIKNAKMPKRPSQYRRGWAAAWASVLAILDRSSGFSWITATPEERRDAAERILDSKEAHRG